MKLHACAAVTAALLSSFATADEVVGYYPGWKSAAYPVTAANVDAGKLTMALYAFVDVCWEGKHGNPEHYSITIAAGGNANYVNDGAAGSAWIKELARSLDWTTASISHVTAARPAAPMAAKRMASVIC